MPRVAALTTIEDHWVGRDPAMAAIAEYRPFSLDRSLRGAYAADGLEGALKVYEEFRSDARNAFRTPFDVVRRFGRDLADDGLDRTRVVYEILLRDYPERARSHELLGSIYEDLGRTDEARALYREALRLLDGDPTISRPLAYAIREWLVERLEVLGG